MGGLIGRPARAHGREVRAGLASAGEDVREGLQRGAATLADAALRAGDEASQRLAVTAMRAVVRLDRRLHGEARRFLRQFHTEVDNVLGVADRSFRDAVGALAGESQAFRSAMQEESQIWRDTVDRNVTRAVALGVLPLVLAIAIGNPLMHHALENGVFSLASLSSLAVFWAENWIVICAAVLSAVLLAHVVATVVGWLDSLQQTLEELHVHNTLLSVQLARVAGRRYRYQRTRFLHWNAVVARAEKARPGHAVRCHTNFNAPAFGKVVGVQVKVTARFPTNNNARRGCVNVALVQHGAHHAHRRTWTLAAFTPNHNGDPDIRTFTAMLVWDPEGAARLDATISCPDVPNHPQPVVDIKVTGRLALYDTPVAVTHT